MSLSNHVIPLQARLLRLITYRVSFSLFAVPCSDVFELLYPVALCDASSHSASTGKSDFKGSQQDTGPVNFHVRFI